MDGEIYTAGKYFTLPPGKTGGTNLTLQRFSFIFALKNRWLLGWKLQGGLFTKRRCAVPDFAASFQHFHCLETLREHFVLILLFRGITNISRIWLILRAVSKTKKKNAGKSRQSYTYTFTISHSDSDLRSLFITWYIEEAVKSFIVFQTPRQKIWL